MHLDKFCWTLSKSSRFCFNVFFSTVTTIVTLKQNDPILLVWLEKQLSGSRYTEIMADGDRFTLPANQKKLRFLRGGLGLGEVVVSDDC